MTPSSGKKAFAEPKDCLAVGEFVRKWGIDRPSINTQEMHQDVLAMIRWWEWLGATKSEEAHAKAVSAAVRDFAEKAEKAVCRGCRQGWKLDGDYHQWPDDGQIYVGLCRCKASAIRALAQENK